MRMFANMQRALGVTLSAAFALVLILTLASPAQAIEANRWGWLRHQPTWNNLIYADYRGPHAARTATTANDESEHRFIPKEGGAFEIVQSTATWTCLDSNHARNAYGLRCNGGDYQRWWVNAVGTGTWGFTVYEIRNKATGLCLDGNNAGAVYTHPCNRGVFQQWAYQPF
ncbi:RICIN domain-containing protein [Micromonospora sp. NBC_01699]|uniref:RICIN domain-containing protein n=1 Tax=Micromonospora sp. NBC_01699 TaxID=2975984 RepID=UPI002E3448C4|nr:RICIN domain-containing protein [Micromonospora sp. NBC_01699]